MHLLHQSIRNPEFANTHSNCDVCLPCFVFSPLFNLHRVLNVLRHWVEFHYYDFERDSKLLENLENFVKSVQIRNMQKWVTSIHRALKKVHIS